MRTRNQAKRHGEEDQAGPPAVRAAASCHGEDALSAASEEAVGRLLKRVNARKTSGSRVRPRPESPYISREIRDMMMECSDIGKRKAKEDLMPGSSAASIDTKGTMLMEEKCSKNSMHSDANEMDWEEGMIPSPEGKVAYSHELLNEVTVEFTESPSSAQRRPSRRVSLEDKELAELVHKVHLLCLVARGRLIDDACNDTLIQASLLSLLPLNLLKIAEVSRMTANVLGPLVHWFHDNFRIKSQSTERGCFKTNLAFALETREGTNEEMAALSVALFRALNLTSRFVSNLDVASLKPDADMHENSSTNATRLNTKISSTITPALRPTQIHTHDHVDLSDSTNSRRLPERLNNTARNKHVRRGLVVTSNDENHASASQAGTENFGSCSTNYVEVSKRKGDLEFELQLAMALAATETKKEGMDVNELQDNSSLLSSHAKKMRIMKTGESSCSSHGSSGAVWSRKSGPPLYWAEVYCVDESLAGRWIHVDAANGLVDGEEQVESASAVCKKPLRYAVAFAGTGAKDVTRRYCRHWYRITSQRINSNWWDAVLAPLKELESSENSSQGCSGHVNSKNTVDSKQIGVSNNNNIPLKNQSLFSRTSLEDMDLETRSLTEPLPTNQLAYKNHNLYAIEKWLIKYQVLHPKGPIVGWCSGHPVYPRSCVQTVQTRQKWLRDGLQVRESEIPAKVIKRSKKLENDEISDAGFSADDGEKIIELFGRWQLEPLQLPHAVNGIVPKNEYGRVDVWSEKCLPPGTVHLRLPRLVPVARRLGIDFANAMVGFEFRNGRSYPVHEGIVVCTEFRHAIMEAYAEEEEMREAEERRKNEADALSKWFQLLSSIVTRQRLENSYAGSSPVNLSCDPPSNPCGRDKSRSSRAEVLGVDNVEVNRPPSRDHEHMFQWENQRSDEDGTVRTKRCSCGVSIQVEVL